MNRSDAHYLTDIEGTSPRIAEVIQKNFKQILITVINVYRFEQGLENDDYVYLATAMCWNYIARDQEWLIELEVFEALLFGSGRILHPVRTSFGLENSLFKMDVNEPLCLASYAW